MKKLFKFVCMMAAIIVGQSAWAQGLENVQINNLTWSTTDLNSIITPEGQKAQFEKQTSDGFMVVNITNVGHSMKFVTAWDLTLTTSNYLSVGQVDADAIRNGIISWRAASEGYKLAVSALATKTKIAGTNCMYKLGDNEEVRVDVGEGTGWVDQAVANLAEGTTSVPFYFRGLSDRWGASLSYGGAINTLKMEYVITPDAPTYLNKDLLVTVDTTNIHWYTLAEQVEINPAFAGTLKFDVQLTKGSPKYLYWNEDHTAFYILKPLSFAIKATIEKGSSYSASETTSWTIDAKIPEETPQVFYYVDDVWVRDVNEEGVNFVNFFVTEPVEHFVEYVCMDPAKIVYNEKGENCISYLESPRARHDYFYMKQVEGSDNITVTIGAAGPSTLRVNGVGLEKNRVEFTVDSANQGSIITNTKDAGWEDHYREQHLAKTVELDSCLVFGYSVNGRNERYTVLSFTGVPDSIYFTYGNLAENNKEATRFQVAYATTDNDNWVEIDVIQGQPEGSADFQYALPLNANRVRLNYWGAVYEAFAKNVTITEKKLLDILPADTLVNFGTYKRKLNTNPVVLKDSLSWINLFPELRYTVDEPFASDGRIRVRLDQWDTVRSHNKFDISMRLDTVGVFTKRLKVASMDVTKPQAAFVTLQGIVTYDVEDMFAKINNKDVDSVAYGTSAVITIQDSLHNVLKHDSLIVSYEYNTDSLKIENDTVSDICVGNHRIVVKTQINTIVPKEWSDTLYIYAYENEFDTIRFNVPDEVGVHDTLTSFAIANDSDAVITYTFSPVGCMEALEDGRIVVGNNTYADSVTVYATASQTCEHFQFVDSQKVWIRGVVRPEFNPSIPWQTDVFGNDTLVNPFQVLGEDDLSLNDNKKITIAFEYNPDDVVIDSVANQWYLRRSTEDSLFIKVTISGDSIKTAKDSIKFPVREYTVKEFIFPKTIDDRGYFYVGDTMKVQEFRVIANERKNKELTKLVQWSKTFKDAIDGTVLPDGSIVLDSTSSTILNVCVDTLFVKDTCADFTFVVKPAVVKDLIFPGVDSIYTVGDSIAMNQIQVKDTADRDITRYVRFYFEYVPEDFAHNTGDSLNYYNKDFIVLDKNGLDTAAVDTVISYTRGGLVTEKQFKDRLLIAPVYAVNIELPTYDYIVGDTIYTKDIKAIDAKGNDVTRYSSFIFVVDPETAHAVEGGIVVDKAGSVKVKIVAKRNESMHQGSFTGTLNVAPVKVARIEYPATEFNVFDTLNLKAIQIFDALDRNITDYATLDFTFNGLPVADHVVLDKAGSFALTTHAAGNVADTTINQDIQVNKYAQAKVVYDSKTFIVGDEVAMSRFTVEDAAGKKIATSYYTFSYELSENDAHFIKKDSSVLVIDSLSAEIAITLHSEDIQLASAAQFTIEADPLTAARIEFPAKDDENDYFVGEGFKKADIKVFDAKGKDITIYAKDEFTAYKFNEKQLSQTADSIFFEKAGRSNITVELGTKLVNPASFKEHLNATQLLVDSIAFPDRDYTVADTIYASEFKAFVGQQDVTNYVEDIVLSIGFGDGHILNKGKALILDKKGNINLTAEVLGRSNSENYEKTNTITVEAVTPDSFLLPQTTFTVLDSVRMKQVRFFKGELEVTQYVQPAYSFDEDAAHWGNRSLVLDKSGELTITVQCFNNAQGNLSKTINVGKYTGAAIKSTKEDATYVVSDELTPEDFYLVGADGKKIEPRYSEIVLSSKRRNEAHVDADKNLVFDKATNVTIYANVTGEVEANQYSFEYQVGTLALAEVVFPEGGNYHVLDSIAIADLKLIDVKGNDVTETYAKGAIQGFEFAPDKEKSAHIAGDYIVLDQPHAITVTTSVYNADSITADKLNTTIFADLLKVTAIEYPTTPFIVGQTLAYEAIKVFAGDRDITKFATIKFSVDNHYAHFIEKGIIFDQVGTTTVRIIVEGFGEKLWDQDVDFTVNALTATSIEGLNPSYNVFDQFDTKTLVVKADGVDVTNYATCQFAVNNDKAHIENGIIYFDKAGDVEVTVTIEGNVTGEIKQNVTIVSYQNLEISYNPSLLYVADEVKLADFKLIDKNTSREVAAQYELEIIGEQGKTTESGDNIILDKKGAVKITAKLKNNEKLTIADAEFNLTVLPANARVIVYPDGPYIVGDSINIASFLVIDTVGRNITRYAENVFQGFEFTDDNAVYNEATGSITFVKKGTTNVIAYIGNEQITSTSIKTVWPIDQAAAASVALVNNVRTVGDTIDITEIDAYDKNGYKLTQYSDLQFSFDEDAAHFAVVGFTNKIILDKAGQNTIAIIVDGRKGVEQKTLTPILTVNPVTVDKVVINGTYQVTDPITTDAVEAFAANGLNITRYIGTKAYQFEAGAAHAEGEGFILDKSGDLNITVILQGANISATPKVVVKNVAKIAVANLEFPETTNFEYRVGDVIKKADFIVRDINGNDITKYAVITFVFNPSTAAKVIAQGNIEVVETGNWTLTAQLSGDVVDNEFSEQYFVRHNVKDHKEYDLLVRIWEDMLTVANTEGTFVNYVWYKDEKVIAGQTAQNYYVRDEDRDGKEHVYYVIAFDAQGNQYLISEKTFVFNKDKTIQTGVALRTATYLDAAAPYAIQTSHVGTIRMTNSNGVLMQTFQVQAGENTAIAPASTGVFVLHFTTEEGQVATQKIIVK